MYRLIILAALAASPAQAACPSWDYECKQNDAEIRRLDAEIAHGNAEILRADEEANRELREMQMQEEQAKQNRLAQERMDALEQRQHEFEIEVQSGLYNR